MRRLISGALALAALTAAMPSSADVQACLAASEKGQRARAAGKLREARESFLVCGGDACPTVVRRDCSQWSSDLAPTVPTVVFAAHDKGGRDLFDVTVSMDGEPLVTKLDGKAVDVDPGKHTFTFDFVGLPPASEVVLIREGERARPINVTFDGLVAVPPGTSKGPSAQKGHTIYPWILVGAGAVGVTVGAVIALTAPDRPSNCDAESRLCTLLPGQRPEDLRKDQERAGTADSQPTAGLVVAAGGLSLLAVGLIWHFLEPGSPPRASARLLPWTTGKASGLALGMSF